MKFQLGHDEPLPQATSEELAKVLLSRLGLTPRKKDANAQFHKLILELCERKKQANREKKPEAAVMPVELMSAFAGIKRQTMYDHLSRWLDLHILKKTSFVAQGKVIIGYELNGPTLEAALRKAETIIKNHVDNTLKIAQKLQQEIKREKIKAYQQQE
jgi:hypothetical protein